MSTIKKKKKKSKKPEEKRLEGREHKHADPFEELLQSEEEASAPDQSSGDDREPRTSSGDSRPGIERPY